ncbi:MAG: radical SAM protein [Sulfolobales archaeon]
MYTEDLFLKPQRPVTYTGAMSRCLLCGSDRLVSDSIGVCVECLRRDPDKALAIVRNRRIKWRISVDLPLHPPRHDKGLRCSVCVNECVIGDGFRGYCGVWMNSGGRMRMLAGSGRVLAYAYLDPIPTNCVAAHICPGSTGLGYPEYAYTPKGEYGYSNLAVFMAGCSLDCFFCQNWEHKTAISGGRIDRSVVREMSVEELVERSLDPRISCVCYFGGDPTPSTPMLIQASREIIRRAREKNMIKRICWETNGLVNPLLMREMARLSLVSGGIVKIDWKAWTPSVYEALTGVDGEKALKRLMENVKVVHEIGRERSLIPLLLVSILLVPGYVDSVEVDGVTSYIAELDPETPVVFLAFHPDHLMRDLPPTSWKHMREALRIAEKNGLKKIYIGNIWLLGDYY